MRTIRIGTAPSKEKTSGSLEDAVAYRSGRAGQADLDSAILTGRKTQRAEWNRTQFHLLLAGGVLLRVRLHDWRADWEVVYSECVPLEDCDKAPAILSWRSGDIIWDPLELFAKIWKGAELTQLWALDSALLIYFSGAPIMRLSACRTEAGDPFLYWNVSD